MKEGPFTLSLVRRKGISFIFLCFFLCFSSLLLPLWSSLHFFHCQQGWSCSRISSMSTMGSGVLQQTLVLSRTTLCTAGHGGERVLDPTLNSKWKTVSRFAKEACPLVLTFNSEYERLFMHLKFIRDLLLIQWLASNCYACSCAIQLSSTS